MLSNCKHCGKSYERAKHNQLYCSKECNIAEHNGRRARLRREKNGAPSDSMECAHPRCSEKFAQTNIKHRFCSAECRESDPGRVRRGTGIDPQSFGNMRAIPVLVEGAGRAMESDPLIRFEIEQLNRPELTGVAKLQAAILEEAIDHVRGKPLKVLPRHKQAERDEAIRWLKGEDDEHLEDPFKSSFCFAGLGINQAAAIERLGI